MTEIGYQLKRLALWFAMNRLALAFNVLIGRPTMFRMKLKNGMVIVERGGTKISGCSITTPCAPGVEPGTVVIGDAIEIRGTGS